MSNEEIVSIAISKSKNQVINLGTTNGWTKETGNLYKALTNYIINGSAGQEQLGSCYYLYTFQILFGNNVYTVKYSEDSSG